MGNTPQMLMGLSYQYHNYNVSPLLKDFNIFYGVTFVSKFPIFKVCQTIVWRNHFPLIQSVVFLILYVLAFACCW